MWQSAKCLLIFVIVVVGLDIAALRYYKPEIGIIPAVGSEASKRPNPRIWFARNPFTKIDTLRDKP